MIKAQLNLFQKNNGTVINDIANEVDFKGYYFQIKTISKKVYKAKKILLCPGAFVNFFNLTESKLALTLKGETTIWAAVNKERSKSLIKASFPVI